MFCNTAIINTSYPLDKGPNELDRVFLDEEGMPTSVTKGAIAAASSAGAISLAVLRDPADKHGKVAAVYVTNFATTALKPIVATIPVIPRVVLYPVLLAAAFGGQEAGEIGRRLFPLLSGCSVKFASCDVGRYLKRANRVQEDEDDDDSDDDDGDSSNLWLCSKEGDYKHVEEAIENTMKPALSLVQDDEGRPYLCTRVGITAASVILALATNMYAPGSFASYCMMGLLRKVLKPVLMPTPLIPRFSAHAVCLGSAAVADYSGIVSLPIKVFPAICDFSFSLLTVDVKKGMKGDMSKNAWCCDNEKSWCTEEGNNEDVQQVEEIEVEENSEKTPPSTWKQVATVTTTLGATVLAYTFLPNSLTPLLATDLFAGSIKPVIKRVAQVPRYALLAGAVGAGYLIQHYTGVPSGTICSALCVKSALGDVRKWTKGKKVAEFLPASWNPTTWFCPPEKVKKKDKELQSPQELDEEKKESTDLEEIVVTTSDESSDKPLLFEEKEVSWFQNNPVSSLFSRCYSS